VAVTYTIPGVYREDFVVAPAATLPTGVPGFVGVAAAPGSPVLLNRADDFAARLEPAAESFLREVVAGFFANGGVKCYVAAAQRGDESGLLAALDRLGPLNDLDLIAIPDAMALGDEDAVQRVQAGAVAHCATHGNRFAILDAARGRDPRDRAGTLVDQFRAWRRQITSSGDPSNAALYYPWLAVPAATAGGAGTRLVPPCGHVAGIFARADARVGVHKAPANEELLGVVDLEFPIDSAAQDGLNPEGINCLRLMRGRGLRVWGARTLSADANWRYINVRRLFLTLSRWIDRNMPWAAFEPNTPRLWNRIQRELTVYLDARWRAGALKGASAAEAFYVKCDADTNPADEREQGRVTTEIGLSPMVPAEFIVVRVIHRSVASR
jgi:hypothetical protein